MVLALVGLEIEVEHQYWPAIGLAVLQRAFDDRSDTIEEILPQRRLAAIERVVMGDDRPLAGLVAKREHDVLLDDDGNLSGGDRSIDAIAPAAVFGIRVVR